jgi:hypothetical protein
MSSTFCRAYVGGIVAFTLASSFPLAALAEPPELHFLPLAAFETEGDSIQSGVRVSRRPDGSVLVAEQRFESNGAARGVPVSGALGGGYLFFQPVGSSGGAGTALFRAAEWTGTLRPLGTVPFIVSEVRTGFDRFYLLGAGRAIGLDPHTGSYLPLDPLPPVATILDLDFDPVSGRASLRAPIVGTLVTNDSGLGWQAQPVDDAAATERRNDEGEPPSALPRHGQLAAKVVLRGGTLPGGLVVALVDGERVSLAPDHGVLRHVTEPGLDRRARCQALPPGELGEGDRSGAAPALLWFECRGGTQALELRGYRLLPQAGQLGPARRAMALVRREVFPGGPRVVAAGRLGVLLDAPCAGKAPATPAAGRAFCLIGGADPRTLHVGASSARPGPETFAVGSNAVYRLSLLADGGISSERLDAKGEGSVHRIHHEAEIEALVFGGTWLPGATVFEEGIAFWATRGESYVGVRLETESHSARVGAIQRPLRRAFLSSSHALAWGASGFARLSIDSGMTFGEIDYPFVSGDQDPSGLTSPGQALELGCGPAGCSLGPWLSVGWRVTGDGPPREAPPMVAVPPLGGGRFRFVCAPVGESSPPALFGVEREEELKPGSLPLPPFWERAAPQPALLESAYSVGDHRGLARLYTLGPRDGPWWARGRTSVVFRSPFGVKTGLESLPTSDLFADGGEAQTLLGILDRTTQTTQTELDPGGEGGVLMVRNRQQTTLFAFGHRESVQRFDVPEDSGMLGLSGAVLSRGTWYVGSIAGGEFRVVALGPSGPKVLAAFPLGETGPRQAMLTRSTAGDLGIAIDGDLGLLIHPLSLQGTLGDTLFQPFRGSRPPECPAEATGYLVVRELGIAPYVEVQGDELDVSNVTMRRLVGFGPECIDGLAADARGAFESALFRPTAVRAGGTPLVVTDRSESGRRVRLSCH